MKLTLERKMLIGFIFSALLLVLVYALFNRNKDRFIESTELINHTHEVVIELHAILVEVTEAETSERGYILTGGNEYLEPFKSAKSNMIKHLAEAKFLTRDNPAQQENLGHLGTGLDTLVNYYESCIELRRTQGFLPAQKIISAGFGRITMQDIVHHVEASIAIEDKLLKVRQEISIDESQSFARTFFVILMIIAAIMLFLYIVIRNNLISIKRAEEHAADKYWHLNEIGTLAIAMQGNRQISEVAQVIIDHMARCLNAQIGAIYIVEAKKMQLTFLAGYAVDKIKRESPIITLGEGLVGQCALGRKTIAISQIPENYFVIDTGIGAVKPQNIIAVPLVHEDSLVGVIELGTITAFTELQKLYLESILMPVSIGLAAGLAREEMKKLLEETQRQAEELEAQQEELRQSNDNLHAKTFLLEQSESNLKAQQEELQLSNQELEENTNQLEEQMERLEVTQMELETKTRDLEVTGKYKSEFLSNMSHELRTPLNSILILAQLLSENKNKNLDEKQTQFAKNICSSGNDLLSLINEILDLAKVEAGKVEIEPAQIVFNDVVTDIHNMFDIVAKEKDINFKIEFGKSKTAQDVFVSDKQRVEQVLRNLLSNAFKFTESKGSVTLHIEQHVNRKSLNNPKLKNAEQIIAFSVIDNGIGIPFNKQNIVFEAFQQADGSTKRKYGGTGLGLSISRELAATLGGELQLESKEGEGSTFTFYLPLTYDSSNDLTTVATALLSKEKLRVQEIKPVKQAVHNAHADEDVFDDRNTLNANDKIVLIIEDDLEFSKILLDFVRERNYKGIVAAQGNAGLSFARFYRPDAILLDMGLPLMNGDEILKLLKSSPDLRHIPVQIITGGDHKKVSLGLGAFSFLAKPVQQIDLQRAFDNIEGFMTKKVKRLLLVEDNDLQIVAIKELIGNSDVKTYSATSGNEALEMLQKDRYDCIVVDLGLPDMLGYELLETIKANPLLKTIPVIVYTGRDLDKSEANRLAKLADAVVLKTANSHERLLDETTLFLHRVELNLPQTKQAIIRKLHKTDEMLNNKKVLLVDDDIRNVFSLSSALEADGIPCITAENGKAALKILQENPDIDIVLMDVMMPEMNGYEATREIRKMPNYEKLPVIAITAKAMKGDREKCLAAGMSDFITKPVNVEQLISLMRVWLYK